jgi:hypothetical protein
MSKSEEKIGRVGGLTDRQTNQGEPQARLFFFLDFSRFFLESVPSKYVLFFGKIQIMSKSDKNRTCGTYTGGGLTDRQTNQVEPRARFFFFFPSFLYFFWSPCPANMYSFSGNFV